MSRAYRNCQTHVQRLRVPDQASVTSGSRGCVPGELCHLLSSCCSNPRRYGLCPVVRLCECMPWAGAGVKSIGETARSEIPAKIAVFFLQKTTARFSPAPKRADGVSGAKALSHCATTIYPHHRSNGLEARAGTFPPFLFPHAMPP